MTFRDEMKLAGHYLLHPIQLMGKAWYRLSGNERADDLARRFDVDLTNKAGVREKFDAPRNCFHKWEPVSLAFETQLLDEHGRVRVRQPDLAVGRCYFICQRCASHTYMTTQWIGWRMYGSEDAIVSRSEGAGHRPAWQLKEEQA